MTTPGFADAQMARFGNAQATADGFRIALEVARASGDVETAGRLLDILAASPRLELPLLSHPRIGHLLGRALGRMFGKRILACALSSDFQDPMRFFSASAEQKA